MVKFHWKTLALTLAASLALISCAALARENPDQEQQSGETSGQMADVQAVQDAIRKGEPWEDIRRMVEELETADLTDPGLTGENGGDQNPSMTGTMVSGVSGGGNDSESLSLMFARMQMELSQSSKNSASANIKEIQRLQEEQTQAGSFLNQARKIRTTVQSTRKGMPMPDTMKYYMDTKKIPCPQAKQGNLYSDDEWGRIVMNLETYLEKVGTDTQRLIGAVQNDLAKYNDHHQAASSAASGGTLQGITRGQSLFSEQGGAVSTAPIATSLIIGVMLGMLVMWGIQKKKSRAAGPEERA